MPTIYRLPKKSISARKPSKHKLRLWIKHRILKNKPVQLPFLKN